MTQQTKQTILALDQYADALIKSRGEDNRISIYTVNDLKKKFQDLIIEREKK